MELNCEMSLTLTKLSERTEEIWEYDAPQFFDFTRVGSGHEEVLNTSDYFRIDHESESTAFSNAICSSEADAPVQPDIVACSVAPASGDIHTATATSDQTVNDYLSLEDLSEAQDTIISPQKCRPVSRNDTPHSNGKQAGDRGRVRCVDNVITSAKKRLSMSVDRGRDKLAIMAAALADYGLSHDDHRLVPGSPLTHCKANMLRRLDRLEIEPSHRSEINLRQQENTGCESLLTAAEVVAKLIINGNEEAVEHERNTRAATIPHVGILFKPLDAAHKRCTSVKPFSFEERNKKMLEVKEERIRRVLEAEKKLREFRAQPFPDILYSNIQPKSTKPLTVPIGPHLPPDAKPKKVGDKQPSLAFRAKPAAVVHKAPFVPAKSAKPTTGHVGFNLRSEHRAARRADWDKWKEEKDRKEKEERDERERQLQKQNEAELKRMRQMTVHKAQPLPRYLQAKSCKVSADKDNSTESHLAVQK